MSNQTWFLYSCIKAYIQETDVKSRAFIESGSFSTWQYYSILQIHNNIAAVLQKILQNLV